MSNDAPVKKKRKFELDPRLAAYKGVWVFIEHERGQVHPVSWELLGEGRKLADMLGVELAGVVLAAPGEGQPFCQEAFAYGADLCYLMESPVLKDYRNDPFTRGMTELVNTYQPEVLLLGATTQGRDLAGSVATTLATGLTADCTGLTIDLDNRSLAATRPTFGGSLLCTIVTLNYRPQMATVRPRVMGMPERQEGREGRIIEHPLAMAEESIITKVLDYIPDDTRDKPQLPFADIIVSGGKGLAKPENFQLVWDLARVLGAEVGASRPVVQAGWVELDRQVGQSGKTVRPKLYIAAGISGAIQHRVGMEGADCIVAINNDPNAPIFDFAHYGIVGDALQLLPALTEAFRQKLATARRAG
ncbi:electron transfer flavoprotein subunit alpha/FixB family protein [Pseudothauera rhizosphaerae]|uniref:Electron transfer flavoprotein subunit alpha/FixB family protein n=1 Tax=Pseudothauera rhizosphaerae TaxID=2565932 RepID=A0A4V3WAG9_9RHOO|nr:electron transfer flavoprotein subunit alpha/FixB family protein [Pseudothauera rhizosphaerae]THF59221.1 electron transfer flavoprotein subunit alpha/FixB family protein [Pseudothauera rhizosphaerae]